MNFPIEQPIVQFLFWLIDTPGIGGIVALLLAGGSILAYALTLRWIRNGAMVTDETETFVFPTPALHHKEPE